MNTISRLTDWYQCIYKIFVGLIEAQFLKAHCILRYYYSAEAGISSFNL